jgi:hypothetical protein
VGGLLSLGVDSPLAGSLFSLGANLINASILILNIFVYICLID